MTAPFGSLYINCPATHVAEMWRVLTALYPDVMPLCHEGDDLASFVLDVAFPVGQVRSRLDNVCQQLGLGVHWAWYLWNEASFYDYREWAAPVDAQIVPRMLYVFCPVVSVEQTLQQLAVLYPGVRLYGREREGGLMTFWLQVSSPDHVREARLCALQAAGQLQWSWHDRLA